MSIGTNAYSDCWASYAKISKLTEFKHQTVNHSYNFLDPDTGTCTNRIESLWNASKHKFKDMRGCNRTYIQSYLDEFVWRFNNGVNGSRTKAYELILEVVAYFYKPGNKLVLL